MPTELTKRQERQEYINDRDWVASRAGDVYEWAVRIRRIREGGCWKEDAKTWEDWCEQFCAKSAGAIRKIIWREEHKEDLQQARGISSEAKKREGVPGGTSNSSKPKSSERKPIEVSARVDNEAPPAEMHKPTDLPRVEQLSISQKMEAIVKDLDRLSHKQLSIDDLKIVCRVLFAAKEVQSLLQPALPMEVESSKKRSKGTREEVIQYCLLVKLTREDGEWFYEKNVGSGWKVNGRPINDWQATINAWRIQKIFPSQKESLSNGCKTGQRSSGSGPARGVVPNYQTSKW